MFDHNGDKQSVVLWTRYGTLWPMYDQFEVGWLQPLQLWLDAGISLEVPVLVLRDKDLCYVQTNSAWISAEAMAASTLRPMAGARGRVMPPLLFGQGACRSLYFSGGLWRVAPAKLASYDNQPPPSTPGQLPGTSKGVCVCLNIIAPSIPLTDKTVCIVLQF